MCMMIQLTHKTAAVSVSDTLKTSTTIITIARIAFFLVLIILSNRHSGLCHSGNLLRNRT